MDFFTVEILTWRGLATHYARSLPRSPPWYRFFGTTPLRRLSLVLNLVGIVATSREQDTSAPKDEIINPNVRLADLPKFRDLGRAVHAFRRRGTDVIKIWMRPGPQYPN